MSCPYCNQTQGWGPIQEPAIKTKWYLPSNPIYKCALCNGYVKKEPKTVASYVAFLSLVSTQLLSIFLRDVSYGLYIVLPLAIIGTVSVIILISSNKYVKDKPPNKTVKRDQ